LTDRVKCSEIISERSLKPEALSNSTISSSSSHFKTRLALTMAPVHSKHTSGSTQPASGPSTHNELRPTNLRNTILIDHIRHIPTTPTCHSPRDFWHKPDLCPSCKNYGPRGDICTTCKNPCYYYGNKLSGEDTYSVMMCTGVLLTITPLLSLGADQTEKIQKNA
jgi:hypothetical protein